VVEVEDAHICRAAVDAWMLEQVLPHQVAHALTGDLLRDAPPARALQVDHA
jgi:hypothetical protein